LTKQELATAQLSISSFEKLVEQLRKERDAALDESAIANIKVRTT